MDSNEQQQLTRALAFSLEKDGMQRRKTPDAPPASHLLQVCGMLHERCACDKLHKLGLVSEVRTERRGAIGRASNAGPEEQVWFFGTFAETVGGRIPPRLEREFTRLLAELVELPRFS